LAFVGSKATANPVPKVYREKMNCGGRNIKNWFSFKRSMVMPLYPNTISEIKEKLWDGGL
jgi:hypothetical protein